MSHIASWRLRVVAERKNLTFTNEELDHLITCPDCLEAWFYFDAVAHGQITGYGGWQDTA
jgi:hypothetical protein